MVKCLRRNLLCLCNMYLFAYTETSSFFFLRGRPPLRPFNLLAAALRDE